MFRLGAAQFDQEALIMLGAAMTAEFENPISEDQPDPEENPGISCGYTYLGQFIYHDLTHQSGVAGSSTPRFDLTCVYGLGPRAQPFLYASDGQHMALGEPLTGAPLDPNARGVPRNQLSGGGSSRALSVREVLVRGACRHQSLRQALRIGGGLRRAAASVPALGQARRLLIT